MKTLTRLLSQRITFLIATIVMVLCVLSYSIGKSAEAIILPLQAIPQSSYLQTCRNVVVANGALSASCRNTGGDWVNTLLKDYKLCVSDIANANGTLTCTKSNVPKGSYLATCIRAEISGTTLSASCRDKKGRINEVKFERVDKCTGDIGNLDGMLTCAKGNVPSGSYLKTCIRPTATGNDLTAYCLTKGGGYRPTSLSGFGQCNDGVVSNLDGHLTCAKGNVPSGSYLKTCINPTVNGTTLLAKCQTKSGSFAQTSLDKFSKCSLEIGNDDGVLRCHTQTLTQSPPKKYSFCLELDSAPGQQPRREDRIGYGENEDDAYNKLYDGIIKNAPNSNPNLGRDWRLVKGACTNTKSSELLNGVRRRRPQQ